MRDPAVSGGVLGAFVRGAVGSMNTDDVRGAVLSVAEESERPRPPLPITSWIWRLRAFLEDVGGGLTIIYDCRS